MKIFICEDDTDILELMQILLEDSGHEFRSTTELANLVESVKRYSPDLLLLDYWIKGKKVDSIVNSLQTTPELADIPIILISAIDNLEEVASKLQIADIIKKPFDIADFQNKVNTFIT